MWETIVLSHRESRGVPNFPDSKTDHIFFMENTTDSLASEESNEEIHCNTMADLLKNSFYDDSNKEVNLLYIHFLR